MEPIRYVEAINDYYQGLGYPPYQWTVNKTTPFTRLEKPLRECRVSMLTSGGISHCTRPPFNPQAKNDLRLDDIDPNASEAEFEINDSYYDTRDAEQDLNVVFPISRLREFAEEGMIGSIAPRFWSGFMGRTYTRARVTRTAAPALASELQKDEVDLFLLVPA